MASVAIKTTTGAPTSGEQAMQTGMRWFDRVSVSCLESRKRLTWRTRSGCDSAAPFLDRTSKSAEPTVELAIRYWPTTIVNVVLRSTVPRNTSSTVHVAVPGATASNTNVPVAASPPGGRPCSVSGCWYAMSVRT